MNQNSRFTNDEIDVDLNLEVPVRALLLGGDASAQETIQSTLAEISGAFDVVALDNAGMFTGDEAETDTAMVAIIASGDAGLDSHWAASAAEQQRRAPVVLIDTQSAGFDERLTEIAWRHVRLDHHAELNNALDAGLRIGHLRLALDRARGRQWLTTAAIAAILDQDDSASAILNGTKLVDPTPALAGMLGSSSIERVVGTDFRDWIKKFDRLIFNDALERTRKQSTASDVVVRIVTADNIEYGVRISMAPPQPRRDRKPPDGDMRIVVASADNQFRPALLAYCGHAQIGGRMALHNDLAAPRNQAKQAGYGLIAIQIDDLRALEDKYGLAATELFAHRFGLTLAEYLNAQDRLYRTDTGRFVGFVERGSAQAIGDLSQTLQAVLTDQSFDEDDDTSAPVTASVCHIELDEGVESGWSHDDRLARVLRGVEALSRLGGNSYGHHAAVAAIKADESRLASEDQDTGAHGETPTAPEPASGSDNESTALDSLTETEFKAGHRGIDTVPTVDVDDQSLQSSSESCTDRDLPIDASTATPSLHLVSDTQHELKSNESNSEPTDYGAKSSFDETSNLNLTAEVEASDSEVGNTAETDVDDAPNTEDASTSRAESGTDESQAVTNDDPERFVYTPWTHALRQSHDNDSFSLAYQGIADLTGTDKPYYDVLLRYVDDAGGLVEADQFVSDAGRAGLMPRMDRWVTDQALHVLNEQRQANKPVGLFVKLSPLLLPESRDFLTWLLKTADTRRVERGDLIFSFSESDIIKHGKPIESLISTLNHEGFKTALTHAESPQQASSLLDRFPLSFVKLSASFTHSAIANEDARLLHQMIEAIRRYNVPLIAEQIENADAMARLWQAGIDYFQGNFIQKPDTQTFRKYKNRT